MMASFTVYFFSIFGFFSSLLLINKYKDRAFFFFFPIRHVSRPFCFGSRLLLKLGSSNHEFPEADAGCSAVGAPAPLLNQFSRPL
jgi:hypothetical protein